MPSARYPPYTPTLPRGGAAPRLFQKRLRRATRVLQFSDTQLFPVCQFATSHGRATRERRHVAARDASSFLALSGRQSAGSRETLVGTRSTCEPPYAFEAQLGLGWHCGRWPLYVRRRRAVSREDYLTRLASRNWLSVPRASWKDERSYDLPGQRRGASYSG